MGTEARLGRPVDMAPLGSVLPPQMQVQSVSVGPALVLTPASENKLPQPVYTMGSGQVMTDEQLEILRRQISVYATICQQLVEMHKASVSQQPPMPGVTGGGQHMLYDQMMGTPNHKTTTRLRWTPSQNQLQILERLFEHGNGTPNKQRIKEITAELSQHGQIAETNVYNWFQNRKARAKRKHLQVTPKDGDSEVDTDVDSPREKRPRLEEDQNQNDSGGFGDTNGGASSDAGGGGALDQRSGQFDQQDTVSSVLMHPQGDLKPGISYNKGVGFDNSFEQGPCESTTMTVSVNDKQWEMPSGMLDVTSTFGKSAVLVDLPGQMIPTNEGLSLHPLQAVESYSLARIEAGAAGPSVIPSQDVLTQNLQQVVGLLNEGLGNGSMMHASPQSQLLGNLHS